VWSAKKTAERLLESVLIAGVFAFAIACFYGFILIPLETLIVDFIASWIMLSVFVLLFFVAVERDSKKV